jgi:TPR repeat protein
LKRKNEPKSRDPQPPDTGASAPPVAEHPAGGLLLELQERAEQGDGEAACNLGDMYRKGAGVTKNVKRALAWYRRGAELGNAYAQNNLGSMILHGMGCKRDPVRAIEWYRRSAEQGNPEAQYNLAQQYRTGEGVEQNYTVACRWYQAAALQGDVWASCQLGTMYWLGDGVERNILAAAEFHLIAAEAGDEVACRNLSEYRTEVESAALAGNAMACLFLCRMSNLGLGAERSQPMAWGWISLASEFRGPDTDAEIANEVREAYEFFRKCVSAAQRKEGQKAVAAMREALTGSPDNAGGEGWKKTR